MSDRNTKLLDLGAMPTLTAKEVARLVFEYAFHFSCPVRISTDQGKCFEAELFNELLALLGIDKSRTTPYYPRGDGNTERFNRLLEHAALFHP